MLISTERIPESTQEVCDGEHYLSRVKSMMLNELFPFYIERIIKEVGFGPGKALEIGPGPLPLGSYLCKQTLWEAIGAEISEEIVQLGRKAIKEVDKRMRYRFEVANAEKLPFDDNSFNLVFSSGSLHHWSNPIKVFQEINRVLAPGGTVVIFDLCREVYEDEESFQNIMDSIKADYRQGLLDSLKAAYLPMEIYNLIKMSGRLDVWQRIQLEQYHYGVAKLNQCIILKKTLQRRIGA